MSLEKTQALLEHFASSAVTTTSKFHKEKTGSGPSVTHGLDIEEFNSAKLAVDKDLGNLLGSRELEKDELVYSVHYSNINGLSQLESNILAHEISEYLGAFSHLSSYWLNVIDSY